MPGTVVTHHVPHYTALLTTSAVLPKSRRASLIGSPLVVVLSDVKAPVKNDNFCDWLQMSATF